MTNKYFLKMIAAAFSVLFLLGVSVNAQAFGLGSFTGGGDSGSSVDTSSIVKTSKKMAKNFNLAMSTINYAQAEALEAFGMADDAEKARVAANLWKNGISDEEVKDKEVGETKARDEKVAKFSKNSDKMTGKARKHLAKSVCYLCLSILCGCSHG